MWLMRYWLLPEHFQNFNASHKKVCIDTTLKRMYVLRHLRGEIDVTEKITATSATQFQTQAMSKSSFSRIRRARTECAKVESANDT